MIELKVRTNPPSSHHDIEDLAGDKDDLADGFVAGVLFISSQRIPSLEGALDGCRKSADASNERGGLRSMAMRGRTVDRACPLGRIIPVGHDIITR